MPTQMLNRCFLFQDLPDEACAALQPLLPPPVHFVKGDDIVLPHGRGLMLLLCGRARVAFRSESGERPVKFLEAGHVFGAAGLFSEGEQAATVVAIEDGQALFVPERMLTEIWLQYPQTAQRYIRFLTERVRFLNRRVAALAEPTAHTRLWQYLLQHCEADGTVRLDRSMSDLAKTLGIGRASLYRALDELQAAGRLRHEDHVRVSSETRTSFWKDGLSLILC